MNIVARTALDGDRHWATARIRGSQPKQNRCRDLSSTNSGSKPKKTDIILCLLSNSAGARRGRIGQGNALWNARPKMRRYLQRVNCHFIRALCAPSVSSCGSCKMVMDGGHLHAVISSFAEIFVEGPLARSMLVSYSAMGCRAHCASLRCVL